MLICGGKPVFVEAGEENNFHFDPAALEAAITPKTKAFIVNSPSNPTGGIAGKALLEQLADIAIRHDLYVISDEVYGALTYENNEVFSIAALPGMQERTIVINSFSKTYAMTGWRVGYALGPSEIIGNMVKLQENVAACVNSAAQFGAIAALEGLQRCFAAIRRMNQQRGNHLAITTETDLPLLGKTQTGIGNAVLFKRVHITRARDLRTAAKQN